MSARIHYLHARRQALHAVERQAHLRRTAALQPTHRSRPMPAPEPTPPTRAQIVLMATLWLTVLALGLWLAHHDPYTLSRAMSRLLGEVPA